MISLKRLLIISSICATLIAIVINSLVRWSQPTVVLQPLPKYDFVVVGAGTAGCIVARRLWERTNASILVIEAGTAPPWISWIPLLAPAMQRTDSDWAYKTCPQQFSQKALKDRQSAWPRGKALGGSGSMNYLLHMWGSPSDFNDLWTFGNDTEWNFESVRHYFKKSENYRRPSGAQVSDVRGTEGPTPVWQFDGSSSPLVRAFIKGVQQLGINTGDLNGDLEEGVMLSQNTIHHGWRISTFDAYLKPVLKSSRIHLLTDTLTTKVVIEGGKATAVTTLNTVTRKIHSIGVTREVIICAGVIGSPQLLLLSGIGSKHLLADHGISVVHDSHGVGQNLMDHLNVPLYFHINATLSVTTAKARSPSSLWKYITKGTVKGRFSFKCPKSRLSLTIIFEKREKHMKDLLMNKGPLAHSGVESCVRLSRGSSKVLFMFFNLGSVNEDLFTSIANFDKTSFLETFPDTKNDSKEGFILLASCSHPLSRGKLSLLSSNPLDHPLIDPEYLSKTEDVDCLKKAIRLGAKLGTTEPMRELGSRIHLPGYSSCLNYSQSLEDERYLECWIRMSAITAYHSVGTCAMGPADHPLSVVDTRLRVIGMKNLRVVDSSVFPNLVSGNPNAATMMIAEKSIDFIV